MFCFVKEKGAYWLRISDWISNVCSSDLQICIVGVGMTRFGKPRDRSVKSLVAEAVGNALSDANAQQGDVGAAVFSNITQGIMEGQHAIRGQVALRSMGFSEIPIVNVANACAGGATALHQAAMMLRAGLPDVALATGVEKIERKSVV